MEIKLSKNLQSIWWEQLAGPSLFLREVAETLLAGHPLCLVLPDLFPWRETFVSLLREFFLEYGKDLIFEELLDAVQNPGQFLVSHFDLEAEYRPTRTYEEFLSQKNVLSGRFLYVRPQNQPLLQQWLSFMKEYHPSNQDGFLAVETAQRPPTSMSRPLKVLAYEDFVSEYDTQIFVGLLITDHRVTIEQKKYLSALAVALKGIDAERVVHFIQEFSFDEEEIEMKENIYIYKVWNAQIQVLFPLIMKECRELIEKCRERVDDAFQCADAMLRDGLLDTNGERITDPQEIIEIATIHFLMHLKRRDSFGMETKDYALYIPDDEIRSRFNLLYVMRNLLAHGKLCAFEDVKKLLNAGACFGTSNETKGEYRRGK